MHFLNFYISHGSATRFLGGGEKYYIYFVHNLLLFPTVKDFFQNRLTFDEVIAKIRHHVFWHSAHETQIIQCTLYMYCTRSQTFCQCQFGSQHETIVTTRGQRSWWQIDVKLPKRLHTLIARFHQLQELAGSRLGSSIAPAPWPQRTVCLPVLSTAGYDWTSGMQGLFKLFLEPASRLQPKSWAEFEFSAWGLAGAHGERV